VLIGRFWHASSIERSSLSRSKGSRDPSFFTTRSGVSPTFS
jgi:hypothetical protein